ncbi:tRNA (Guanine-1)-methyltransferase family protein [Theileria parva strain Muguga]|uniref:tRNA (guanine(9)-N(1))-methyltransferase n=1 Tax=Theileria parva TaxID=5875 RepID=Q4N3C5_THEPA|nr:tRNA (Guanine-1)-methyltransferase family protein [Theileria parva strain Muguga]EAN31414.1 tRNA (Guanine-1)-methyltransferase family protein [Theileria parva strain Muguga]|eukprot:XP_763697.1 hypothetical protein [Theileria parva strain Muguga]
MRNEIKKIKRSEFINSCKLNPTIVIDCEFHSYASEKESKSLANQIMQSYGANKRAEKPFNLVICGIKPQSDLDLALGRISGTENWTCQLTYESLENIYEPEKIVYLSADSEHVIEDLSPDEVYVIGGIVDRNRLNGITYNKARIIGSACKRLPIKEHIKLSGSHVLSVNNCVEILLNYYQNRNWELALKNTIPKRKLIHT